MKKPSRKAALLASSTTNFWVLNYSGGLDDAGRSINSFDGNRRLNDKCYLLNIQRDYISHAEDYLLVL